VLHRRIIEEPVSRLAVWSRRVAIFAIPVVLLAIIIGRANFLEIVPSLATLGGALALAVVAMLLALGAFIVIWREGNPGFGLALTAMFIGLLILAYPAYLGVKAYRLPAIFDVTTDPIDPPRFEAIGRVRSRTANPVVYAGMRAAELQRAAYPDIESLDLSVPPLRAFEAAREIVTKRRWQVIVERPPQPRREGHIEAIARTPIMNFRDDVVIRIRAVPDGSRVDIRSASRYGRHDLGTNASRIRSLIEDIDDASGDDTPKRQGQKGKKGETPAKKGQTPARR
jgi:uncharacterized protein (DUF1499 family)